MELSNVAGEAEAFCLKNKELNEIWSVLQPYIDKVLDMINELVDAK